MSKEKSLSIVGQSKELAEDKKKSNKILFLINERLDDHGDRISTLEDTMRVNGVQESKLTKLVNKAVVISLDGKDSNAYADRSIRGKAYSEINGRIKDKFGIPRRGELPAKDYKKAVVLIENWSPYFELKQEIKYANRQLELAQGMG